MKEFKDQLISDWERIVQSIPRRKLLNVAAKLLVHKIDAHTQSIRLKVNLDWMKQRQSIKELLKTNYAKRAMAIVFPSLSSSSPCSSSRLIS